MTGMSSKNGTKLTGIDHLRQSITDILSTRIGSRVMRRDYGSNVRSLIDAPINQSLSVDLYIAVNDALTKWEPRFKLKHIAFKTVDNGHIDFTFNGTYLPNGQPLRMEGVVIQ